MSLKEIVKQYLAANGYDGLYLDTECGCLKDDLFPCGSPSPICEPGYKVPCVCGEGCDFDIGRETSE